MTKIIKTLAFVFVGIPILLWLAAMAMMILAAVAVSYI